MAQSGVSSPEPPPSGKPNFLRRFFNRQNGAAVSPAETTPEDVTADSDDPENPGLIRRVSRKVVPGLPRVQTFKRQQSERRNNLAPVQPTPAERRAVSVDRRAILSRTSSQTGTQSFPRSSVPDIFDRLQEPSQSIPSLPAVPQEEPEAVSLDRPDIQDESVEDASQMQECMSTADNHSVTTSQYNEEILDELETKWILNLSMHFRDKSKREKFFVTYREHETLWRRVTISVDYRDAPENSLEMDLTDTKFQRDKSSKIYEAIRESLPDIQFYDTVTNLKLQTTDGRLHVHVVEDVNEIIHYPTVRQIQHMGCRLVREREIVFDSHMSGFVYKVEVHGEILIKKEIPGPDTIDEFLYEINALNTLHYSNHVIRFHGVVVDDHDEYVKGLLISYAEEGALIDVIYDYRQESLLGLPWPRRVRWARQIVQGLSDIHESGFVQGDFTLSNIVIDRHDDAKIIDINRRGCPMGWEPPEATPLIDSNQRISMYIGVKSDLYQLGMVLWALATQEDEPETHSRPLLLGPEIDIPPWYRQMVSICLSAEPRRRLQALSLLKMFPVADGGDEVRREDPPPTSFRDGYSMQEYFASGPTENGHARVTTLDRPNNWSSYVNLAHPFVDHNPGGYDAYYYSRGRSPPSPLPSNYDQCDTHSRYKDATWGRSATFGSYSDVGAANAEISRSATPTTNRESLAVPDALGVHSDGPGKHGIAPCGGQEDLRGQYRSGVGGDTENGNAYAAVLAEQNVSQVPAEFDPQDGRVEATESKTVAVGSADGSVGTEQGLASAPGITGPDHPHDGTVMKQTSPSDALPTAPAAAEVMEPLNEPSKEIVSDTSAAVDNTLCRLPRPTEGEDAKLPDSLTGVGAAHDEQGVPDEVRAGDLLDELDMTAEAAGPQSAPITTEEI